MGATVVHIGSRKKIVILGMICNMPYAGVVWQYMHYMLGFERLGYEVYYVESPAKMPSNFMSTETDDGVAKAVAYLDRIMREFGFAGRWAYHVAFGDNQVHGMTEQELKRLYSQAELIINMHGGTIPLPEHYATNRLVYLETDPVQLQIELAEENPIAISILEPHCAFFTFGENYGNPDCGLPVSDRFTFWPTRQPVLCDLWQASEPPLNPSFTTIGNWVQDRRTVVYRGETYYWSKHREFLKFLDLPSRTAQPFELALSSYTPADKEKLESQGWRVRNALEFTCDTEPYRQYIRDSYGEFTVAKDQNVRLRSGWFSDRSATYLAAGRPVITQDTGFGNILPTGKGIFGFASLDDIIHAVDLIRMNHRTHCEAARNAALDFFNYNVVLGKLLAWLGEKATATAREQGRQKYVFPDDLDICPISRDPLKLAATTADAVLNRPVLRLSPNMFESGPSSCHAFDVSASVIVLTHNALLFTRLCLESLLTNSDGVSYELIVVDNASSDGTREYLQTLASSDGRLKLIFNDTNVGFAAGNNQALAIARGKVCVLLNSDTIMPPDSLADLVALCSDKRIGIAGPVTNRTANEAQIATSYRTYGEMIRFAKTHRKVNEACVKDIRMLAMYCVAFRRDVLESVGSLDERFEVGMFEDDDYCMRVRCAGYRVVIAENLFVHHFGGASFGTLEPAEYRFGDLFHANRRRWEKKWGVEWSPHARRITQEYDNLVTNIRRIIEHNVPVGKTVIIASKGDGALCELRERLALHFPLNEQGLYAGHHPANSTVAIQELEARRSSGAVAFVLPSTMNWWRTHYPEFFDYLEAHCRLVLDDAETCIMYSLESRGK